MSRSRPPAALPELVSPTSAAKPPSGPGWIHEIKYDGYRIMAQRAQGGTRLFTRNGHDWSTRYPVAAVEALWARSRVAGSGPPYLILGLSIERARCRMRSCPFPWGHF